MTESSIRHMANSRAIEGVHANLHLHLLLFVCVITWHQVELRFNFHMYFQSFPKRTNLSLFFVRHKNSPLGIFFIAVELDFHVFVDK